MIDEYNLRTSKDLILDIFLLTNKYEQDEKYNLNHKFNVDVEPPSLPPNQEGLRVLLNIRALQEV